MKKIYLLLFSIYLFSSASAQTVCDGTGNLIIYSNYDGGYLNIDVDQNIPNLKIGICTYEGVKISISGAFASNVTQVWYAGADGSNNHCGSVISTGVTGIATNLDTIEVFPTVTLADPNGDANMVCATGCSNANSGGCNTTNQVVDYFMNKTGATGLYYHQTQYGCFLNLQTWKVSNAGNCCLMPPSIGITEQFLSADDLVLYPNPTQSQLHFRMHSAAVYQIEVFSIQGKSILTKEIRSNALETQVLPIEQFTNGVYYFKVTADGQSIYKKFVVSK